MRVLHLVTSLDYGGLETRMELLSEFPTRDVDLVFAALGGGGAAEQRIRSHSSAVELLHEDVKIVRFRTLRQLYRLVRQVRPTLIHAHGAEANFYGSVVGRIARTPVVCEEIGESRLSPIGRAVFRCVFASSTAVISMSEPVREGLVARRMVRPSKVACVYNPVRTGPLASQEKLRDGAVRLLFLGRLEPVKNPLGLLEAVASIADRGEPVTLSFAGTGSQMGELTKRVEELQIGHLIRFHGYVADPHNLASDHDIIVQTSHSEGFSLALVEAMSWGLAAVATPVGGAAELLADGVAGWLARSSSVGDIRAAILGAIDAKDRLAEMGAAAAHRASSGHDPSIYGARLRDFYTDVLDAGSDRRPPQ